MKESKNKMRITLTLVTMFLLISTSAVALKISSPVEDEARTAMLSSIDKRSLLGETQDILENDYEERDPIHIEGDDEFANQAKENGWPGDGSEDDPYVIEGYRIDGGEEDAISINEVNLHIIIRETVIEGGRNGIHISFSKNAIIEENVVKELDGGSLRSGISIRSSEDFTVKNNVVKSNNYHGIGLQGALNMTISDNLLLENGITLISSINNTIVGNMISKYTEDSIGINFHQAHDNVIQNNHVYNQYKGVDLYESNRNYITNNTLFENEYGYHVAVGLGGATSTRDNLIFNNNFIGNEKQAVNRGENYYYNETESMGNYYSDYEERYPDAEKANGYWDTPYGNDEGHGFTDEYPMIEPSVPYIDIEHPSDDAVIDDPELTISWTGMYRYEERLEYEVRLDEGGWKEVGEETEYDLKFSKPGHHTFEVRASNVDVDSVAGRVDFTVDLEFDIRVEDFEVEPLEGIEPLEVNITAKMENLGDDEGDISLYIGEEVFKTWTLDAGEEVFVDENYEFEVAGPYVIILGDETTEVTVTEIDPYELTINVEGEGTVEGDPEQEEYEEGTDVDLTAEPDDGWRFVEWTGDHEGTDQNITIVMDEHKEITAHFKELTAEFVVNNFTLGVDGLEITVIAEVENVGDARDTIELLIEDEGVTNLTLGPGENETLEYIHEFEEEGTFTVELGDRSETVTVEDEDRLRMAGMIVILVVILAVIGYMMMKKGEKKYE